MLGGNTDGFLTSLGCDPDGPPIQNVSSAETKHAYVPQYFTAPSLGTQEDTSFVPRQLNKLMNERKKVTSFPRHLIVIVGTLTCVTTEGYVVSLYFPMY